MIVAVLGIGVVLGAISSMMPGPCNLAVLDAARRHGRARALATGLGTALADAACAATAVAGIGQLVSEHPALRPILQGVSGLTWVAFGLAHLRVRPASPSASPARPAAGFAVGFGLVVANPATILSWVVIVASVISADASPVRWAIVPGICLGSFATYAAVARLGTRDLAARLPDIASRILVAYGTLLVVRAVIG